MDVRRFDVVTAVESESGSSSGDPIASHVLFTVPAGKAYTITGFSMTETAGESGEITFKIGTQVIGQFGVSGPDTIYPITNVNLSSGESLIVEASLSGLYVSASVVIRDVDGSEAV